jgi:hypothetical protein
MEIQIELADLNAASLKSQLNDALQRQTDFLDEVKLLESKNSQVQAVNSVLEESLSKVTKDKIELEIKLSKSEQLILSQSVEAKEREAQLKQEMEMMKAEKLEQILEVDNLTREVEDLKEKLQAAVDEKNSLDDRLCGM